MICLNILLKNVGEWHTNVESRDILSSDETESSVFKRDSEDHDDEYEEVSPKHGSLKETPVNTSLFKTGTAKENCHDHHGIIGNTINGNGVHEIHREDQHYYNDRDDEGNLKDDLDEDQPVNGEENHNDRPVTERNEEADRAPPVPYYGRTLLAPEYMNFQLEEASQKEEKTAEDDNDNEIAVADELSDDLGSPRAEEETADQTVQKEVLEEDDITLSEEESDEDEDGNDEEEDQRVRADCQVEEQYEEEEQEEEEEVEEDLEEEERKGEENTAGEISKHSSEIYCIGSPQLAQAEDDKEEDEEGNECDEVQEESSLKEQGEVEVQKQETTEDGQRGTQSWESSLQLAETDDDDQHDGELDIATTNDSNLKHSDSLKVQVAAPTPNIGEVGSVAESFDDQDEEGVNAEDDGGDKLDREEQECTTEGRSFNETVNQHEERKKTVRIY